MTISPLTGEVDSTITITGTSFLASTVLTVTFDGIAVTPTSGATTSAAGAVAATIAVPDAIAGIHYIVVTDGTSSKTATFTVTPDIIITPQSGEAGATVLVSGTGFGRRVVPNLFFNSQPVSPVTPVLTNTSGTFTASFIVPKTVLASGSYQIEADDNVNVSTAPFTLIVAAQPTPTPTPTPTPEPAKINVSTSGDTAGSNIVIVGSGYAPASPLSVTFDDVVIESGVVKADGTFVIQFTAPAAAGGDHVIAVSDNTVTKQYTYTIETTPPAIPPPLEPAMGVTVESPITFDWDAVTDLSAPVTYELQVAGDNYFTAASILFEVTAVAESSYLLTEAQELKLAGRAEAYYWRIRAVDAAVNPSPWTGGGEFYISPPFSVPTWLIYTLAGVGAVIIFGIGYLVGRRTAFYY
ncbi:MAG: hypothetical protein MUO19_06960 [Dehalococcoidales bacterium]|nr:hypothetical protein [Dehalococcoidales bacterium]